MKSSEQISDADAFGRTNGSKGGALLTHKHKGKGGWVTFPFIIGTVMGLSLAAGGWYANITVYAIQKYNIQRISAAQIHNIVGGGVNFFPIVGAILADTFFGSYWIVLVAALASLLGGGMFTLSAAIPHLRPLPCNKSSRICQTPSTSQYAFLYITLALAIIGLGGTRFVLGTIGADQYDRIEHQKIYFNWFIFAFEFSWVIAFTVLVYVQDNVSWAVGYGISVASSTFAISLFLFGSRFYRRVMPQGSPFTSIGRVFIASFRKAKLSVEDHEYFYETTTSKTLRGAAPSSCLRFFNKAALLKVGNTEPPLAPCKSWSLCTVEEVEDFKKLMKAMTIWGAGLLEGTIYAVSSSLITIQALVMDRHLGHNFQIPAGSVFVFTLIWASFLLTILDRFLYPLWERVLGSSLTPLQRVGIGYFFNVSGMVAYAMIERKRLDSIENTHLMDVHDAIAPMSVLWLSLPLALLGSGTAFYFPAEVEFYYQEFPKSLRTTSNAMTSLRLAVGYYLSSAIVDVVRKRTTWLPNDINHGRLDKVYWLVSIIGGVNLVIYLIVAKLYKYNSCVDIDDVNFDPRYMDIDD